MSDPVEEILKTLDAPASPHQAEIRGAFLAEAAKLRAETVSQREVVRHKKWMRINRQFHWRFNLRFNQGVLFMRKYWAMAASTALIMFIVTGIVVGQEIIDFFSKDSDDEITVNVYTAPLNPDATPIPKLPLSEAVASVSFEVVLPEILPGSFRYEPNSAHLGEDGKSLIVEFTCSHQQLGFMQYLVPIEEIDPTGEVGASAIIENVQIGDVTGQYVKGWWHSTESLDTSSVQPGTPIPMDMQWDNSLEFHRLYWYQAGMLYSLQSWGGSLSTEHVIGGCRLSKESLLEMANSLKPAGEITYGD